VGYSVPAQPKEKGGFRLDLGDPWEDDLTDFCAANYNGSKTEVIREALEEHLARRLLEPVMKARFDRERNKRLAAKKALSANSPSTDGKPDA
jgi:hypothetical protein